jgi:signal transduction histidine kinase
VTEAVATLAALVSRLGARVAHDLNNVSAVLGGHLYLLRASPGASEESLDAMEKALAQVQRLTRSLGKLGATSIDEAELFSINAIARQAAADWPFGGTPIRLELEEPLPPLSGRPRDVRQALDCLLVNAKEASAEGQEIRIATSSGPGPEIIRLAVEDSGRGMAPEVQKRAFDPLFTTKAEKGFGIGLTLAAAVAAAHRGGCAIDPRPEGGTRVTLSLPKGARPPSAVRL